MKNFLLRLSNNAFVNSITIFIGIDKYFKRANKYWKNYKIAGNKSHQEVAGYSHTNDVQEAVDKTHLIFKSTLINYLKPGDKILDIGCGPGLYLKEAAADINLFGVDINSEMLALAAKNNPKATLYEGEFLTVKFDSKFNLVCSVGMLQYVSKGEIKQFFDKISDLLEKEGIIFISYPHAIKAKDLSYPDLDYINYSPAFLNKLLDEKFTVLQNKHVVDERSIEDYDPAPYEPLQKNMDKTYKNSSILIAQKK
jgi:cyclopropane fatty-acyl-phospholipid synthase-like methyltransferase